LYSEILIFLFSTIPTIELRGGLILAKALNMNVFLAFALCFLGSMLPVPFILLFLEKVLVFLETHGFENLVKKIKKLTHKKNEKITNYKHWGLMTFVAIPLPGTGVWAGALVAVMLGIDFKKSFFYIGLGNLIAASLMIIFSYGLLGLFF
jgi:uncharacterized membrane protein